MKKQKEVLLLLSSPDQSLSLIFSDQNQKCLASALVALGEVKGSYLEKLSPWQLIFPSANVHRSPVYVEVSPLFSFPASPTGAREADAVRDTSQMM